jgi:hypothetical protein
MLFTLLLGTVFLIVLLELFTELRVDSFVVEVACFFM